MRMTSLTHFICSFWEEVKGPPKKGLMITKTLPLFHHHLCVPVCVCLSLSFCTALNGRWRECFSEVPWLGSFHRNRMRGQRDARDHLQVFTVASFLNLATNYQKRQTPPPQSPLALPFLRSHINTLILEPQVSPLIFNYE